MSQIFLNPSLGAEGALDQQIVPSTPLFSRAVAPISDEQRNQIASLQRGEIVGDVNQILQQIGMTVAQFERSITSTTSGLPIRENLESEVAILTPMDTPMRNRIKRVPGAGLASSWRQATSIGGKTTQVFFSETGSPVDHSTAYANKSASYKLLGVMGGVTGFAMAAGANFQNQLAAEKTNAINNLMLNEENAIINGDATSTAAPWGDGTTAFAFNGLKNLITTANGTPTAQVQATVGALTTAHIDSQLQRLTDIGGKNKWILANGQEIMSLVHLAEAENSIIRVQASSDGKTVLGVTVTGYVDPLTGEVVPVLYSRDLAAGTILFGCDNLPDGKPSLDISVLPQAQLPELAPNQNVQGYVAQELAPTQSAAQVYNFIVTVYEVLRMKSALVFAKSTGVTAV